MKASNGIRRSKYLRQSDPNMAEGCVEEQGNGWGLIFLSLLVLFFCICISIVFVVVFVFVFVLVFHLFLNRKCISSTRGRPVPSINDNGSARSVVHTPDKVTVLNILRIIYIFSKWILERLIKTFSLQLNGQLKNHLDSIFSGFQKLISGSEK